MDLKPLVKKIWRDLEIVKFSFFKIFPRLGSKGLSIVQKPLDPDLTIFLNIKNWSTLVYISVEWLFENFDNLQFCLLEIIKFNTLVPIFWKNSKFNNIMF
jgi:hypothetical protein